MKWLIPFAICVMLAANGVADEAPKPLTPEERTELEAKLRKFNGDSAKAFRAGKVDEATDAAAEELRIARRLYPASEYPDGHATLATGLHNLAFLYKSQGKYAEAEPLLQVAVAMRKRLFKGDHADLATSLNNLGALLAARGKYAEAEPIQRDALAMRKRLFKGDHPNVASSLNNLANLHRALGKFADAEPLYREALEMWQRLAPKQDHPEVAVGLCNLGGVLAERQKNADAEPLLRDGLDMFRRLFRGDHPDVTFGLNGLSLLKASQGKVDEAIKLQREALEMGKRLYRGDHPEIAASVHNLAGLYWSVGKYAAAEPLLLEALAMDRRMMASFAGRKSEGEALTLVASLPLARDGYLSNALMNKSDARAVYGEIWESKGAVARIYEQRQQAARAAAADPKAAKPLGELAEARRRRADLLLAPDGGDPAVRKQRDAALAECEARIGELDRALFPLLPSVARADKLAKATPTDLQKALATDAAVVDFLRYSFYEQDKAKPGKAGERREERYLAFLLTKEKIVRIELGEAAPIDAALTAWRESITGGKEIAAGTPAKVRELLWDKIRKEFPAGVKTVYISPDSSLCRVPWAALPGDGAGTILLEDFSLATIPHAGFLLDALWPREVRKNADAGVVVVGGVKYDAESPKTDAVPVPSGPLVKPGAKIGWSPLPGTAAEATGVGGAAGRKKFQVAALAGAEATPAAVLAALPKAKAAHFATHGFFADASFRSAFQLDPKDYETSLRGERIGRAANSPLVMTGLVFAGANDPKTPGRGIITGEALVDLDLSGLELAVLSACETGLGDVAGGEGTFGLQRIFHLAGTRDVVASLWKVPDQSTAALMALFYKNLWTDNLSSMESLRRAQLEVYRNPAKILGLAQGFRGKFQEVPGGAAEAEIKPGKGGMTHPLQWAAFTLSGPGR